MPEQVILISDRPRFKEVLQTLSEKVFFVPLSPSGKDRAGRGKKEGKVLVLSYQELLQNLPDFPKDSLFFLDLPLSRARKIGEELKRVYPRIPIVLQKRSDIQGEVPFPLVDLPTFFSTYLNEAGEQARLRDRVEKLKDLLLSGRKVLILTHPNPDPDAIASAFALKNLFHLSPKKTTLGYLGRPLSRPENVKMISILEIPLRRVEERELKDYTPEDRIILVDCQENLFTEFSLPPVHGVIDHHPEQEEYYADYRHVVPEEGSTSTIITQYYKAMGEEPSERVATALLYGVKSDTFFLKREVNRNDIESFVYLYPRANINILKKMELPDLPLSSVKEMGEALKEGELRKFGNPGSEEGIFITWLEKVSSDDLIPRLADWGLQVQGITWSLSGGVLEEEVILCGRNVGYVKHAGKVFRDAFKDLGSAGGHRSAARAILPYSVVKKKMEEEGKRNLKEFLIERLLEVLK